MQIIPGLIALFLLLLPCCSANNTNHRRLGSTLHHRRLPHFRTFDNVYFSFIEGAVCEDAVNIVGLDGSEINVKPTTEGCEPSSRFGDMTLKRGLCWTDSNGGRRRRRLEDCQEGDLVGEFRGVTVYSGQKVVIMDGLLADSANQVAIELVALQIERSSEGRRRLEDGLGSLELEIYLDAYLDQISSSNPNITIFDRTSKEPVKEVSFTFDVVRDQIVIPPDPCKDICCDATNAACCNIASLLKHKPLPLFLP
jgi:hypothetical protein